MAAAVVAWSPVIMRTRMPASLQSAIASFASLRGGSTMPTRASSVRSSHHVEQVAVGSNVGRVEVARGDGEHAQALAGQPVVLREHPVARAVDGDRPTRRRRGSCDERASSTSGAPLTKQRTTFRPSSSISWKVAMSLYSESNGTSATRG